MADYLPTTLAPSPQALQARRLADLLQQKEAMGVEPIRSPWQGVGKIAQSIAGGYDQYLTDRTEAKNRSDAMSQILNASQGGNQGALLAAAMNPYTPEGLSKALMEKSFPTRIPYQGGSIAINPMTQQPIPGSFISEDKMVPQEAEGVKTSVPMRAMPNGGYTMPPVGNPPNAPVRTNPDGTIAGNVTAPAPPAGTVAQNPAAPISPQLKQLSDFGIKQSAAKKSAETTADSQAKYYESLHTGLAGTRNVAAQQKVNLDLLSQIAENPDFRPGGETTQALQRLGARFGINPTQAAPREIFNMVAAKVLGNQFADMKSMAREGGEQSGRIFAPMLKMEEMANVQPGDSIEGTKAKINIMRQWGDQAIKYGNMADEYIKSNGKLDSNFDTMLHKEIGSARIPNAIPQKEEATPFHDRFGATFSRDEIKAEMARRRQQ